MASRKNKNKRQAQDAPITYSAIVVPELFDRITLMLFIAGLALGAYGAFVTPRDLSQFLWATGIACALGVTLGFILGGAPARRLEARLLGPNRPADGSKPLAPAALPPPAQAALRTATLPLLLATLANVRERMAPRERAAAVALVEAGATAPEGEARQTLARDLPRLLLDLVAGKDAAAQKAEDLAQRLAGPASQAGRKP